jgi:hypothetical protein
LTPFSERKGTKLQLGSNFGAKLEFGSIFGKNKLVLEFGSIFLLNPSFSQCRKKFESKKKKAKLFWALKEIRIMI